MIPALHTPALFFSPSLQSPKTPRAAIVVGVVERSPAEPTLVHLAVFSNPDCDPQRVPVETVRAVLWLDHAPDAGKWPEGKYAYPAENFKSMYIVDLSKQKMDPDSLDAMIRAESGSIINVPGYAASEAIPTLPPMPVAKPCCERDGDKDGNCDRHPIASQVPTG